MKITKILSVILTVFLLLGMISICATAQENQSIDYDIFINGNFYSYTEVPVKLNAALELKVENVTLDGEAVDPSKISYQWEKSFPFSDGRPGLGFNVIDGANECVYNTIYDGALRYRCTVTVEGAGSYSMEVWLKEDTLIVDVQASKPLVFEEEGQNYCISDLSVGDEVTLVVNATTTVQGGNVTYSWDGGDGYVKPDSNLDEWGQISNNTNTLTVTKREGQQNYYCTVSDGNVSSFIFFMLTSKESITHTIIANGEYPGTYAGTYIYVTKPGSSVKLEIPATSTEGDVKYSWYYASEGYVTPEKTDNVTNTFITTKSPMTEENPYAWEVYECYLEDGNDRVRYWIMLFCLDPDKPLSQVEKIGEDTPDVEIKSENEDLANAVFTGEELNFLSSGAPLEVTISAESKQTVSQEEKAVIDEKLTDDSNVGMYLDINIYKGFEGEEPDQVAELNKTIDISVDLPEDLVNTESGVKRDYSVVRMHNGVAETIPCTYDKDNNTLVFSSDKFSTYTIVYTDSEEGSTPNAEAEKQPNATKPNEIETNKTETDKTPTNQTTSPLTGDTSVFVVWAIMVLTSAVTIVGLMVFKKKLVK